MTRVLIVDDHAVVREGIGSILEEESDLVVVGRSASGEDALRDASLVHPDVVVMSDRLPGLSGPDVCALLTSRAPTLRVVIVTDVPNDGTMLRALSSCAVGFVLKRSQPEVFRAAVRSVAGGGTYCDPALQKKIAALRAKGRRAKGPYDLTLQEMKILERLPRGMSNRDIGVELGVSESTVKTHLYNAMHKLRAKDRAEAAAIAIKEGLA